MIRSPLVLSSGTYTIHIGPLGHTEIAGSIEALHVYTVDSFSP